VIGLVVNSTLRGERLLENRDQLVDSCAQLFAECQLDIADLKAIAIGIGPGSFTGLRVGLAYAKGIARALQIPIWPVSSLQIIAANLKGQYDSIIAITPARSGQAHLQRFAGNDLAPATESRVCEYESIGELLDGRVALVGPGIDKLEAKLAVRYKSCIPSDTEAHRAHALILAELAQKKWSDHSPPTPESLVPEYGLEFGK
jgi:tRNA threonylcarbamoyladenosine biosynthesis protein TsaB